VAIIWVITGLEPETIKKANLLIPNSYHWSPAEWLIIFKNTNDGWNWLNLFIFLTSWNVCGEIFFFPGEISRLPIRLQNAMIQEWCHITRWLIQFNWRVWFPCTVDRNSLTLFFFFMAGWSKEFLFFCFWITFFFIFNN